MTFYLMTLTAPWLAMLESERDTLLSELPVSMGRVCIRPWENKTVISWSVAREHESEARARFKIFVTNIKIRLGRDSVVKVDERVDTRGH